MDPDASTLTMPTRPVRPSAVSGGTLAGRYRIGEVIGRGGMSTVYRATDMILERDVAVKVLLAALVEGDPAHVARFEREARAAAALQHPSLVKVYDTGRDKQTHFIVMERVAGQSLDHRLRGGPLEPDEAARIAARVAEALAAAHAAGILHRDVKPANVMLTPSDEVKVLDFGIARARQDQTLTQPAFALGTAAYMSPERVLGRPGDERSDIYSLGCLLYAMLTGRPPFAADDGLAVMHQQVHEQPVSPRNRRTAIGPPLEALVLAMLAKDPARRPQTAAEVARRLAERGRPPRAGLGPGATAAARAGGHPRRWLVAVSLLAAMALAVGLLTGGSGGTRSGVGSLLNRTAARPHLPAARQASRTVTHPLVSQPAAPVTALSPPAKPVSPGHGGVPPGHGGVPPGHAGGGPPGQRHKPPKAPKGSKPPHGPH